MGTHERDLGGPFEAFESLGSIFGDLFRFEEPMNARTKSTVTLKALGRPPSLVYEVVGLQNCVEPQLKERLSEAEVKKLITRPNTTVNIK